MHTIIIPDTDGEIEALGAEVTAYGRPAGTWWDHCVIPTHINDTCPTGIQPVKIVFKVPSLVFGRKAVNGKIYGWNNRGRPLGRKNRIQVLLL